MQPLSYVYRPPSDALTPAHTRTVVVILLAAFTASVFVSTALTNILAGLVCIAAIIRWVGDRPWHLLRHPLIVACLVFVGWALLREVAAGASARQILATADNLRVLLFVALWAPLFTSQRHSGVVIRTVMVVLAVYATLALGLLVFTGRVPYISAHPLLHLELGGPQAWQLVVSTLVSKSAEIASPIYLAALFGTLQHAVDDPKRRRWLLAFALLLTAALLLASVRRQTQVGFALCLLVFAWVNRHQVSRRAVAVFALGLALAAPVVGMTPAAGGLQRIVDATARFLNAPAPGRVDAVALSTSEGQRLRLWGNALPIVQQHPIAGTALSRYEDHYLDTIADDLHSVTGTANPHNEYLYIWGGLGLIGLLLYLAIPWAAWRAASPDAFRQRVLLFYLVGMFNAMAVNSLVIDMVAAHAHALVLLALVLPPARLNTGTPA
jgi:O-antigen ligase